MVNQKLNANSKILIFKYLIFLFSFIFAKMSNASVEQCTHIFDSTETSISEFFPPDETVNHDHELATKEIETLKIKGSLLFTSVEYLLKTYRITEKVSSHLDIRSLQEHRTKLIAQIPDSIKHIKSLNINSNLKNRALDFYRRRLPNSKILLYSNYEEPGFAPLRKEFLTTTQLTLVNLELSDAKLPNRTMIVIGIGNNFKRAFLVDLDFPDTFIEAEIYSEPKIKSKKNEERSDLIRLKFKIPQIGFDGYGWIDHAVVHSYPN